MSDINIVSGADPVSLDFDFQTPQQFAYIFEVVNGQTGNQLLTGSGKWDGQTSFKLGSGSDLAGLFLNIDWSVIDPAGAGNDFTATATASQGGAPCKVVQLFTGKTTAGIVNDSTTAEFIV